MIQAIIFDMDGLLIDSEPFWRRAQMQVFSTVGLTLTYEECGDTIGKRIDEVVSIRHKQFPWTAQNSAAKSLVVVEQEIVQTVIDLVLQHGVAKPGAKELLEFFAAQSLPLGLASSSYVPLIDAVVRRLDIRKRFNVIRSAQNEKHGKPAPDVYLTTARSLGVPPESCLAFEDSPSGVKSAKAAGMYCVAVPEHEHADEVRALADFTINSLLEFGPLDWDRIRNHPQ